MVAQLREYTNSHGIELYIFKGRVSWYVNSISIKTRFSQWQTRAGCWQVGSLEEERAQVGSSVLPSSGWAFRSGWPGSSSPTGRACGGFHLPWAVLGLGTITSFLLTLHPGNVQGTRSMTVRNVDVTRPTWGSRSSREISLHLENSQWTGNARGTCSHAVLCH